MAKTYSNYTDKVSRLVTDKSKTQADSDDVTSALESAVGIYAEYEQNETVVEVTADGGRLYTLPDGFETGISESFKIEYPVSDTASEVQFLRPEMYELYNTPDGMKIRFRATLSSDLLPASAEKFRVHFPTSHVLTDTTITIPDSRFNAVTKLAARELCLIIGNRYAHQASAVNSSSAADYRDKADKFLSYAKEFWNDFHRTVAPSQDEVQGYARFGTFVEDPLNRAMRPLYPRDSSGRGLADV